MRKLLVWIWLLFLTAATGTIFWYTDWQYQQPTPVPKGYKGVKRGKLITLGQNIKTNGKPVFLHFFNPDCACSRFNAKTFKKLVATYGNNVSFVVVVMSSKSFTAKSIQTRLGVNVPVIFDATLATRCGVYSTPQVVLIDSKQRLYYRGNYNTSRYCTDEHTNFARIALEEYFNRQPLAGLGRMAFQAYGCSLPGCDKQITQ